MHWTLGSSPCIHGLFFPDLVAGPTVYSGMTIITAICAVALLALTGGLALRQAPNGVVIAYAILTGAVTIFAIVVASHWNDTITCQTLPAFPPSHGYAPDNPAFDRWAAFARWTYVTVVVTALATIVGIILLFIHSRSRHTAEAVTP